MAFALIKVKPNFMFLILVVHMLKEVLEIFTVLSSIGNNFHLKLQSSLQSVQMVFLMVLELIMKIEFGLQRLMVCTVIIQKVVL